MRRSIDRLGRAMLTTAVWLGALLAVATAGAQPRVVINELMYHPASDTVEEEFIELLNAGDATADLAGWTMSDGVAFTFPLGTALASGEFLVLSSHPASFSAAYPSAEVTPLGPCVGQLSNGGERVAISNAAAVVVDEVTYRDRDQWPPAPDGGGPSLELRDPLLDNASPESWQASSVDGGTPGAANSAGAPELPFVDVFEWPTVHEFELTFAQPNWWELLQEARSTETMIEASFTFNGHTSTGVGVRIKGFGSTLVVDQKVPLKIDFNAFHPGQRFMGMDEIKLANAWSDPTYLREPLMARAAAEVGLPVARYGFASLRINGELWGLYNSQEHVDVSFLMRVFGTDTGNLFKAAALLVADLSHLGPDPNSYRYIYELKTNEAADDFSRLIALTDIITNAPSAEVVASAEAILDVNTALGHLAIHSVFSNLNSYVGTANNYYLYDDPTGGRFQMILWDMDLSFGSMTEGFHPFAMPFIDPFLHATPYNPTMRPPLTRLIDPTFGDRPRYVAWIEQLINGPFQESWMRARIDEALPVITPHVLADPHGMFTHEEFMHNLEHDLFTSPYHYHQGLLRFVRKRRAFLLYQLGFESVATSGLMSH